MSGLGAALTQAGVATTLTNRKGKLAAAGFEKRAAAMAAAAAQKPQGAWEKNKSVLTDQKYREERKEYCDETFGEAQANEWKKKRDKDKLYFGAMDANTQKQFQRAAIGSKHRGPERQDNSDTDSDLDSDDRELLNDPELEKLQRNRLVKIKAEFAAKAALKQQGHGTYEQMDEKDMLRMTAKTDYVVVVFHHKDFERCKIIDHHMYTIAKKHMGARFVKLDIQKSPFMAQKMRIKTLPSICIFIDALLVDKVIGFEELGGKDDFPTVVLEARLCRSGVIPNKHGRRTRRSKKTQTLLDNMTKGEFYDEELDL